MNLTQRLEPFAIRSPIATALIYAFLTMIPMSVLAVLIEPGQWMANWAVHSAGAALGGLMSAFPARLNLDRAPSENRFYIIGSAVAGALYPPLAVGWSCVEARRAAVSRQRLAPKNIKRLSAGLLR